MAGAVCGVYPWLGRAVRIVKFAKLSRSVKLRSMRRHKKNENLEKLEQHGRAWHSLGSLA